MDTLHLVDPELRPLLDVFLISKLTADNLDEARNRSMPFPPPQDCDVLVEQRMVPGPKGAPDVMLHIYRPNDAKASLPCIYHIHGGGYVLGAAKDYESLHKPLAADLGCAIISVDYRLAPETPFPGPIEDCYAGLAWTMTHAGDLGLDVARVGVMGESAGGGLAAGLALLARDRGEYTLAFQHLIYPMLDDRTCVTSEPHPVAGQFIWNVENNHFGWSALLGHEPGRADVSPYAAPARAKILTGLPPTFINSGALDIFVDEDIEYARRLMRAGVATELHVYPGAFHGFNMAPGARVADAARRDSTAALKRFLFG